MSGSQKPFIEASPSTEPRIKICKHENIFQDEERKNLNKREQVKKNSLERKMFGFRVLGNQDLQQPQQGLNVSWKVSSDYGIYAYKSLSIEAAYLFTADA